MNLTKRQIGRIAVSTVRHNPQTPHRACGFVRSVSVASQGLHFEPFRHVCLLHGKKPCQERICKSEESQGSAKQHANVGTNKTWRPQISVRWFLFGMTRQPPSWKHAQKVHKQKVWTDYNLQKRYRWSVARKFTSFLACNIINLPNNRRVN